MFYSFKDTTAQKMLEFLLPTSLGDETADFTGSCQTSWYSFDVWKSLLLPCDVSLKYWPFPPPVFSSTEQLQMVAF